MIIGVTSSDGLYAIICDLIYFGLLGLYVFDYMDNFFCIQLYGLFWMICDCMFQLGLYGLYAMFQITKYTPI